jgi:hypothetical protein
MPSIKGVVIGGDFNTNHDQEMFTAERTLDSLADAGYQNGFEGLPLSERVTHQGLTVSRMPPLISYLRRA